MGLGMRVGLHAGLMGHGRAVLCGFQKASACCHRAGNSGVLLGCSLLDGMGFRCWRSCLTHSSRSTLEVQIDSKELQSCQVFVGRSLLIQVPGGSVQVVDILEVISVVT